jgi:hypothetical protein
MAELRTVAIYLDSEQVSKLSEAVGQQALYMALGYLSTWNQSFPHVDIYRDFHSEADMVAVYKNEDGSRGFTMGAIWNPTLATYTFHS